jgi:para-aminobenzoate synthetase component 1
MNPKELISFKQKALQWANQFEVCCCFDSNEYTDPYSKYDFLLAAGHSNQLSSATGNAFTALKDFYNQHPGWLFGLLSYDLKNELEELTSAHPDNIGFPDLFFFVPQYLLAVKDGEIKVLLGPQNLPQTISELDAVDIANAKNAAPLSITAKIEKATYLDKVEKLREHIAKGDIYEVNFCQEFFAENATIDPYHVYVTLNALSPTPFSGFFKVKDKYILSASPERFLCKRGNKLYSQPIKGTAKRSADSKEDESIKSNLKLNNKEQAENVMIVDLVRNDLTKCAVPGSVKVEELFGIYTFPQVHQMISTVSCIIDTKLHPVNAIRNTFPMGSMTGAPKVSAMQLIEELELSRRGIYSGAFGYFDPEGDFDFNVVIRSILYNKTKSYLSFQVGGAITYASDAQSEYEECLLKASAMIKTLTTVN